MSEREFAHESHEQEEEQKALLQSEEETSETRYSAEGSLPAAEHQYRGGEAQTASTKAYEDDDIAAPVSSQEFFKLGSPACSIEKRGNRLLVKGTSAQDEINVKLDNDKLRITCNGQTRTFTSDVSVTVVRGGKGSDTLDSTQLPETSEQK